MRNTAVIMQDGMNCLLKKLGAYETEVFVWNLIKEPFDYTEWQKEYFKDISFKDISLEDFNQKAAEYDRQHPWVIGVGSDD
jgi:hypothetical protein